MQFIITRGLILLMVIGLAACGNNSGALPTAASITSNTSTNTNPTAETNSAQSATTSTGTTGLEFIHYTVKLTGAEAMNVEGTTQTIFLQGTDRLLSFAGPGMNFQAIVQTPETIQTG